MEAREMGVVIQTIDFVVNGPLLWMAFLICAGAVLAACTEMGTLAKNVWNYGWGAGGRMWAQSNDQWYNR